MTDGFAYVSRKLNVVSGLTTKQNVWDITLDPSNTWSLIETAAGQVTVKRIFDVYEGATLKTSDTKKLAFDATDFNVTGSSGDATVNTEGYTGTVGPFYKYACVSGSLTQYTSTGFPTTDGLVKGNIAPYV